VSVVGRPHVGHPEPQRPVGDGEHGGAHAAAGAVAQQIRPGLGRLAVAIPQRDEFLAAVGTHADHYEQAQFVLFEALGRARLHRVQVPRPSRLAGGSLMGALIS
jgi:creatinine amidohydrolase/Fe(II)-dependent formamide hydrolase-like protein